MVFLAWTGSSICGRAARVRTGQNQKPVIDSARECICIPSEQALHRLNRYLGILVENIPSEMKSRLQSNKFQSQLITAIQTVSRPKQTGSQNRT